jgi:hypothetical protein
MVDDVLGSEDFDISDHVNAISNYLQGSSALLFFKPQSCLRVPIAGNELTSPMTTANLDIIADAVRHGHTITCCKPVCMQIF